MIALESLFVDQYLEIEDREGNMLVAQIQSILDNSFRIGSIISKHRVSVPGLVSKDVFVSYRGDSGDRFQFMTKVISQPEKSPEKLLLAMPLDSDVLKVQQREHFRVSAIVDFSIEDSNNNNKISLQTKDISGGGLSFLSRNPPFEKDQSGLSGTLNIVMGEDITSIPFVARVVYVQPKINGQSITAMEFSDIRESHREKIIKFCMKEQLKRRIK